MHILIIDDDRELVKSLIGSLQKEYVVDKAYTAEAGEYQASISDYDAIIIDFNLPDKTGVDLCHLLRSDGLRVPILMLTGRYEIEDKVSALDGGVDDYLLKPFSIKELKARLRALLRRNALTLSNNILQHKEVVIDLNKRVVVKGNKIVNLRRKEFEILEFLLRNKGQVVRREILLEHVWGGEREPNTNSIEVHIGQLRKKLDNNSPDKSSFIKSVYGLGYQIK